MGLADRLDALKAEAQTRGVELEKQELARQVAKQQALAAQNDQARMEEIDQIKAREEHTQRLLHYHSVLDSENLLEELRK